MTFVTTRPDHLAEPCPLQQHPHYGAALTLLGADVRQVTVVCDGDVAAHLQILQRRFGPLRLSWVPRGPVWQSSVAPSVLARTILARAGCNTGTIWMPDRCFAPGSQQPAGFLPIMTPQHVAEVDLTAPKEIRLARQHGKWRNRLFQGKNAPLQATSHWFDPARDNWLLELESQQRRQRRYAALPLAFTLAWADATPRSIRVFRADLRQQLAAFLLILLHPPTATYHIGWSGADGRRHSAHNLLLWHAANWLADHGFQRFDLGSVDTENTPGLARFKIGSGANVRPLGPTLLRLPSWRSDRGGCAWAA